MAYTRPSIIEIYNRIKADLEHRVTGDVKIPRVSFLGLCDIVFSGATHLSYGFLSWIYRQLFLDTADADEGILRYANILRVPRKLESQTTGTIRFTGEDEAEIPAGTTLVSDEGIEYTTDDAFIIGTDETVDVTAKTAGIAGNTEGQYLQLISPIVDVDNAAEIMAGFTDGQDDEPLNDWVQRLLYSMRNPPACGNETDYIRWALEYKGVYKAWCWGGEQWLGGGTVGLCVANLDGSPVSAQVLTGVSAYVESIRPIPARVTYFTPTPANVIYHVSISPNNAESQAVVVDNLRLLHTEDMSPGGSILVSRIYGKLAQSGLEDFHIDDLVLNGTSIGVNNVTTVRPDIPLYGGCVFDSI